MKGATRIVAGVVAASLGAIALVGTPAAAHPGTARTADARAAVMRWEAANLHGTGTSVRVQQVGNSRSDATQLEAETDKLNQVLRELIANTGFGTGSSNIPKAKLTTLLVNMITKNDPSIAPDVARKAAAALGDLVDVAMALDTKEIATLVEQSGPLSEAVTEIAGEVSTGQGPSPDAIAKLLTSGGAAGTAVLALLITGLTVYQASANLPQFNDLLDVIDPLSSDGAKVFHTLPSQLRAPEAEAALHVLAEFGRTLASIDIVKILKVAQHFTALLPQQS
ncbi:hypothetical protein Athai_58110 [Actinocatenispora thailandica]|uniref:Secreted protein n=1 Tax=Actinocatenispora thailandica TaxID=227318 RepID=A0A7R7DUX9_9ACTN|nr:hypothetical protein [Actinocatenispora thailandica]BCJ38308.1 hypothetical protein Athai_58110 [Actinocatenispora thailandica]